MTPAEAAAFLRRYNEWRRTDDRYGMPYPDPREIGEAIDAAIEMIDRLEAAESEAIEQARLNGMGSEREAALMAKLEAAEKSDAESIAMYRKARDERDALRTALQHEADCVEAAKAEIKALRAKIVRPLAERSDRLERALREVKEAVEHTPLGVRGIKALQAARAALEERS